MRSSICAFVKAVEKVTVSYRDAAAGLPDPVTSPKNTKSLSAWP
jgi:hypothetical protein